MLTSTDIIAGKVLVQLGLLDESATRDALRRKDVDPAAGGDLLARLVAARRLAPGQAEAARGRVGLYERARTEATYLRVLQAHAGLSPDAAAALLAEAEGQRKRVRDVLALRGNLTSQDNEAIKARAKALLVKDDERVLARYRAEDFAGVARGLLPGTKLEPGDFLVSRLFRRGPAVDPAARVSAVTQAPAAEEPEEAIAGAAAPPPEPLDIAAVKGLKRIADYSLIELLGAGGMGAVFLGEKDGAGVYAAVKVMLDQAASKQDKARFKREIALTRRVHHRNVIGIIDRGSTPEGLTYLVVPALVGKDLRALLEATKGEGLAPDVACSIFERVLEGLQAIHEAMIVHRDVKPENVMVLMGAERDVKVMDLGLSRLMGQPDPFDDDANYMTVGGEVSGSPAYIAPETILFQPYDHRTDIYSAGIMFFEMLTGKLPFESETAQGYLGQHVAMPPTRLDEARPERNWPAGAEELLERMLAKTTAERPASCAEVLATLRGGLSAALSAMTGRAPVAKATATMAVVAEAPPITQKLQKDELISRGILGRLIERGLMRKKK